MSDRMFYVAASKQDASKKITGYVPVKFLTVNGKPVVDPTPGGSQKAFIYADGSDSNYLIVPANYTEQQARAFAADIASRIGQYYPTDETGVAGLSQALAQMTNAFLPNGPQDLQRHPRWGIPSNSFVPAFTGAASYHLGSVTRRAGLPVEPSMIGGGISNWTNAHVSQTLHPPVSKLGGQPAKIDTSGPRGLSWHNYDNIQKGFADADVARGDVSPVQDFGYGTAAQYPNGQIGDGNGLGVGDWRFPFAAVDPMNPTRPVPPPQVGPPQGLIPGSSNASAPASASAVQPVSPYYHGGLADWIAALAGVDPRTPTRSAPPPLDRTLRGFYRDDPTQPWLSQGRR